MGLDGKRWNQGDLSKNPFAMERRSASLEVRIDEPAGRIFERACLSGQPAWLAAAAPTRVYSESGGDEVDAVWSEAETGPALLGDAANRAFWTTTILDPDGLRYQSVLCVPELAVGTLDMTMEARQGETLVRFDLSMSVLSEAGSACFDAELERRIEELLGRFAQGLAGSLDGDLAPPRSATPSAVRRSATYRAVIEGDIDECFALACPVAELRWIDGWHFDLVYSESGRNEEGCIFLEPSSGLAILRSPGASTYWYSTRFDTERHRFDAVWLTGNLTLARWRLRMNHLGGKRTEVLWSLTYTSLGEEGGRILGEPDLEARTEETLGFLATSLKHYVETGRLYRVSKHRKVRLAASLIGAALGRHFRQKRSAAGARTA